jgi:hypothetical protein
MIWQIVAYFGGGDEKLEYSLKSQDTDFIPELLIVPGYRWIK